MTLNRQRLLLFLFPILLALPFLNRAFFVDDHFFVEIAKWIKDNPLHPYDFPTEGVAPAAAMSRSDVSLRIVNPLLHHYYLAALMLVGGEREWFLRLGCTLLSCGSALLLFGLARRWTKHAFVATLLVLATPVFWLTSYSLLIDSTMGFLFLATLYAFVRALEENSVGWTVGSGVLMGLSLLAKYTAVLAIPLTLYWFVLNRKNVKHRWLGYLPTSIGLAILGLYVVATRYLYGVGHLFAASGETLHNLNLGKLLVLLVFLTGGTIVPLLAWTVCSRRTCVTAGVVLVLLIAIFRGSLGGFSTVQSVLFGTWLVTSLLLIISYGRARARWTYPIDPFLFAWLLGFLAMMSVVMQWVAVRYYVIGAPAIIFAIVRLVELTHPDDAARWLSGALAVTLLFGLGIAYADYQQAESSRFIVAELRHRDLLHDARNYYFADTFTNTYLAREGWKPVSDISLLSPGDRVITTEVTFPLFWFMRKKVPLRLVARIDRATPFPLKVMDASGAAGFYASAWGPLPFTFHTGPWERFDLFEVIPE